MYSLYYHKNKTNNKLYFGITCKKPEIRWANGTGYKKQPFYKAIKKYGYNATDGGDGTCGIIFTQERKDKIRAKSIGRHPSEETRKKMSDSQKGRDLSYLNNSFGNNPRAKKVGAYKDDVLIKEYDCAVSASLDVGVHKNSISKAIREGYKVKGFKWRYV